ncbi:hypothetical protein HAALTHF_37500n [Vreelandella aquamarina]|nr:hypothetical protein HAALTHF_37500n [Halomonas axialensis]
MVVLLLVSLGFQALSGLFLSDDIFFQAPLYGLLGPAVGDVLARLHSLNSDLLLILIGLHLVGLVWHTLQGERLVPAMLTGVKRFQTCQPMKSLPLTVHKSAMRLARCW